MKKLRNVLAAALAALVLAGAGYVGYLLAFSARLEDGLVLTPEGGADLPEARRGHPYALLSYNLGFGAYSADYSFFMDGGRYGTAFSREAVLENLSGALDAAEAEDWDFALFQEVDVDATRSHHVDEAALIRERTADLAGVYAQNFDSPYFIVPLGDPHGSARSGLLTVSGCRVDSALRRSLPVEKGLMRIVDLDRCYSVSRIPVEGGGKTLCLYHVHLSAYTSDGSVADAQLRMLLEDMTAEYEAGNYAVCGGDFNKDLLGNSPEVFGVSGSGENWAKPFPTELLPSQIRLWAPVGREGDVASCRNDDGPYRPGESLVLTVDGFLTSENVAVSGAYVVDTAFAWSDHNPVVLSFSLE